MRRSPLRPSWFIVAAVALGGASPTPSRAQEAPIIIENIRVGLGEDISDQAYRVGRWTPVQIDLQAGAERFRGSLRVLVADDDGTPTSVAEAVDIPARTTAPVVAYVRPGTSIAEFTVEVFAEGRRRPIAVRSTGDPAAIEASRLVIATLGSPQGIDLISTLPEFKVETENASMDPQIRLVRVGVPRGIPTKWYGYDGVDAVVLDTNDSQALAALDSFRNLALKEWVRNGGHLVVTVGDRWQVVNDSFLADMLPATPNGQDRTRETGGIEDFASSSKAITTPDGPEMAVTRLVTVPNRSAKELDLTVGGPVLIRGAYGLGRVTVIGLNVDQAPFRDWSDRAQFWVRALDLTDRPVVATNAPGGSFYTMQMNDLSSYLHKSMEEFEGVRLIPFAWVAFFVFLYILLIGPGDYFFLKKVLKRMELTWITFPAIVAAVSGLAYATAYAVKGTDLRINRVDIVDVDQGFGDPQGKFLARGQAFATLFSPQNRDYELAAVPLPIDQPRKNAEGLLEAPPAGSAVDTVTSFFGVTERQISGVSPGQTGLGSGGYSYGPMDGNPMGDPQAMRGVRIPIWTTKSINSTWFDAVPPVVDAELTRSGANRLDGRVTNRLQRPLKNPMIAFGKQVYELGRDLGPGETVSLTDFKDQNLSSYLGTASLPTLQAYEWDNAQLNLDRVELVKHLMFNRAVRNKTNRTSYVLGDLDLSAQLDLGRPILVAELEGPASALVLGVKPAADPKIAQTTLVRVLLPAAGE